MLKKILLNRRRAIKIGLGFVGGTGLSACGGLINQASSGKPTFDSGIDSYEKDSGEPNGYLAFNTEQIVGAKIDRTQIKRTIHVNNNHPNAFDSNAGYGQSPLKTVAAAVRMARDYLSNGEGIRILIYAGIYREGEFTIDGNKLGDQAKNAILIIEGRGEAVISGSEIWQPNTWQKATKKGVTYYEHDWQHDFGNAGGAWGKYGPKKVISHRREMLFIDDRPLKQVLLEHYNYKWPDTFSGRGSHTYSGFSQPQSRLQPGTFGVAELDENGNKIYFRPENDTNLSQAKIEVATKRYIFRFFNLDNVVINNLTFQHSVGEIEVAGSAVLFGPWQGENEFRNQNIEIKNCRFQWNNARGLSILNSQKVTLKDNKSNYNGFAGIIAHVLMDTVWVNNETNFNNWRGYQGDFDGWAIAGAKIHYTRKGIFRNHRAIGNQTGGLWFDLSNDNILIDKLKSVENVYGLQLEVSPGPFVINNSLLANNRTANFFIDNSTDITLKNSILYQGERGDNIHVTSDKTRTYQDLVSQMPDKNAEKIPIYLENTVLNNNIIFQLNRDRALFVQSRGDLKIYQNFIRQGYKGAKNIYFSQNSQGFGIGFQTNNMTDIDNWSEQTGEIDAKWLNPYFNNPDNYDFSVKNHSIPSSIQKLSADKKLDISTVKEMKRFFDWLQ